MLTERIQQRIVELTAHQAEIRGRADKEIAAVQEQINALIDAQALIEKDPTTEAIYVKLSALQLLRD